MTLTDSYLSQKTGTLSGNDIKLWLGSHVYVETDNITRDGDLTIAKGALFTACDDCDSFGDAWEISTYKIPPQSASLTAPPPRSLFALWECEK